MKVAIRKASNSFGERTTLGGYAAVAVALQTLDKGLRWKTPRTAEIGRSKDGTVVYVTLILGSKTLPDFVLDLHTRLMEARVESALTFDIVNNVLLPAQKVSEIWLENVGDPPTHVVDWAVRHGWQVEEEPGPGRFWPS
jgi:hypothetical protein